MSEYGGLWKQKNNQHAVVPPETECGWPSGGWIKNGHIRYPLLWRNAKKKWSSLPLWVLHLFLQNAGGSVNSFSPSTAPGTLPSKTSSLQPKTVVLNKTFKSTESSEAGSNKHCLKANQAGHIFPTWLWLSVVMEVGAERSTAKITRE